ncbi:hypothetical protein [Undibacterium sp. RuRC25W]|uniref:hypothetical protein n=1 Tax=Undibacterium sp. RuRC25W TaxID=3413047 RepID=UPI003BF21C1F
MKLFQITQDALCNAIRRAQATKFRLRLEIVNGKVTLRIADNAEALPGLVPACVAR